MKVLFIFGTRPEAIKLAPLIREFKALTNKYNVKVCVTAQHREMLDQVLDFFKITPDYDLNIMQENQSLFYVTKMTLERIEEVLNDFNPELLVVQGDTTTTFTSALAGFYRKIKIAHIEAGLRSFDKFSPYPEEINRSLVSRLADFHFAPTKRAAENLKMEGITSDVWTVGNTAIDALFLALKIIKERDVENFENYFYFLNPEKKLILLTVHRRENFGEPMEEVFLAGREIVENFDDVEIVYPVHPNPNVRNTAYKLLKGVKRVHLIEPLSYPYFVWLMKKSYLILTDSGGIQEEAPSLGKPVLVLRNVTERIEGIEAGTAKLVGTDKNKIIEKFTELITDEKEYQKMATAKNPYGDGKASERITKILVERLK